MTDKLFEERLTDQLNETLTILNRMEGIEVLAALDDTVKAFDAFLRRASGGTVGVGMTRDDDTRNLARERIREAQTAGEIDAEQAKLMNKSVYLSLAVVDGLTRKRKEWQFKGLENFGFAGVWAGFLDTFVIRNNAFPISLAHRQGVIFTPTGLEKYFLEYLAPGNGLPVLLKLHRERKPVE